jgi:hypothetical protein
MVSNCVRGDMPGWSCSHSEEVPFKFRIPIQSCMLFKRRGAGTAGDADANRATGGDRPYIAVYTLTFAPYGTDT